MSGITEEIDSNVGTGGDADLGQGAKAAPVRLPRVVIVDVRDERLRVTRSLLERSGLVEVVGETDSQQGALDLVTRSVPDLVLLEIQMPIDEGIATVGALRASFPQLLVVVCSFHQEADARQRALAGGANAYVTKPIHLAGLRNLLRELLPGTDMPGD